MNLVKRYLSKKLGRGVSAIRLRESALTKLKESEPKGHLTRAKVRQITADRTSYTVLPKKKRKYKILAKSKSSSWRELAHKCRSEGIPVKYRLVHFSDRCKDKTITRKRRWIHSVRVARHLLKHYNLGSDYKRYRARIKGGLYRNDIGRLKRELDEAAVH